MDPHWLAASEAQVPEGTAWLGPWERERLARMRYTKRRIEFLTSRHAAKLAVLRATGRPDGRLSDVEIRHRPGGAPMALLDGVEPDLSISMTDRSGWAACLTTSAPVAVGVDLEVVEPRSEAFVRDYFTAAEQRLVNAVGHGQGADLTANLVWSAKESALKVLRVGLRRDTRSVEVRFACHPADTPADPSAGGGWRPLSVHAAEGRVFPGWWHRFGDFLLTVAAEEPLPAPRGLVDAATLASARPVHSWLHAPLVVGSGTSAES